MVVLAIGVCALAGTAGMRSATKVDSSGFGEPAELVPALATADHIAGFFRPEVLFWRTALDRWAISAGVDPNLAAAVMQIESCGDPRATSSAGAAGLFQVMPVHFYAYEDPYEVEINAARGLDYLGQSLKAAGGDTRRALAGYNGGIGLVHRAESEWPQQTQRYVAFAAAMYEDALEGKPSSAALDAWYAGFGIGLCRQAAMSLGL
jgi:soluble lytic murein transglycosylase-like protein